MFEKFKNYCYDLSYSSVVSDDVVAESGSDPFWVMATPRLPLGSDYYLQGILDLPTYLDICTKLIYAPE